MKPSVMLSALVAVLFAGCGCESPVTKEHSTPVDSSVLGLWELIPDEGTAPAPQNERMRVRVLKYSDTEYMIHVYAKEEGGYFRGYPIKVGGMSCVHLQEIARTSDVPIEKAWMNQDNVVSYQLMDGKLEAKYLNIPLEGKTTEALAQALLKNKDNKELFNNDPDRFRRIEDKR